VFGQISGGALSAGFFGARDLNTANATTPATTTGAMTLMPFHRPHQNPHSSFVFAGLLLEAEWQDQISCPEISSITSLLGAFPLGHKHLFDKSVAPGYKDSQSSAGSAG